MSIEYDPSARLFHLKTPSSSYLIKLVRDRYPVHLGWFGRIERWNGSNDLLPADRAFSPNPDPSDRTFSLDTIPQEYPGYGRGDFRDPAFQIRAADGSTATDLWYLGHRILPGKPTLPGLPSTYTEHDSEADTLELTLRDPVLKATCVLSYTVWTGRDVITRTVRFRNDSNLPVGLLRVMSASLDFERSDFRMLQLSGAWGVERHPVFRPLVPGIQSVESRRGASSHQQNPFLALLSPDAGEDSGEVFAFNLVYSGNFLAQAETDQFASTRVMIGINPFDFEWRLEPGEEFQAPEAVMVRSREGLGGMTRIFHDLYRERLCRGRFRDAERPVLINNWEATYFNFTSKSLLDLARTAASAGIELFVLDDGWFGKRDDDRRSLGDWTPDVRKLPDGLAALADGIRSLGLKFGLWVEPEMISPDSDLYRAHPDWCLHVSGRSRTEGRSQLVMDFSRADVRDHIVDALTRVFREAKVSYVKWDMNRHMTEIGSALLPPERQRETAHRYMLGLYEVLDRLVTAFPDILFESCSGGGGRFDPGMLYYMPQTWTSDNTDALSRVHIQFGTGLVYPAVTMGSHVSAVPNHQTGRSAPLSSRGAVAMAGNLGYELDLGKLADGDLAQIGEQVKFYKSIRHVVAKGDLYRLLSPWDDDSRAAWMAVSRDRTEAVVTFMALRIEANAPGRILKLKGLDGSSLYGTDDGRTFGGDELMNAGLRLPVRIGEAECLVVHLKAI